MDKIAQVNIGEKFLGEGSKLTDIGGIGSLVSTVVGAAIAIAATIFLFLLVFGGIGIMAGAGSQNPEQVEKGKKAVSAALIGFVIVFAAYWIVQLIEVITGVAILG
jgi:hypothetical protein